MNIETTNHPHSNMKFALINSYCGYGSTGNNQIKNYKRIIERGHSAKIFYGLCKMVKSDNEDFVYFGNSSRYQWFKNQVNALFGTQGLFCFISTIRLFRYLNRFQPDVVWLSNIHGDYVNEFLLLNYLKKHNIFTVYGMPDGYAFLGKCCLVYDCDKFSKEPGCYRCPYLRDYPASLFYDNSRLKFNLKKIAYNGFDRVIFRSAPYVVSLAKKSVLLRGKEFYESDATTDISHVFYPRETGLLRKELNIDENSRVVLLCAPYTGKVKGGKYFLEAAKKCYENGCNIVFINVSFDGDRSMCPPNFIGVPYIADKDLLAQYYSLADAYVCTSLADAQPGACREALGCGTPIIGFNNSGVPYIAPKNYGTFVECGDVEALTSAIKRVTKKKPECIKECHQYAKERFGIEASDRRYSDFLEYVCSRAKMRGATK